MKQMSSTELLALKEEISWHFNLLAGITFVTLSSAAGHTLHSTAEPVQIERYGCHWLQAIYLLYSLVRGMKWLKAHNKIIAALNSIIMEKIFFFEFVNFPVCQRDLPQRIGGAHNLTPMTRLQLMDSQGYLHVIFAWRVATKCKGNIWL